MPEKNNFSKSIFAKSLEELTYGDIEAYFEIERQETDRLEFKSYHSSEKFESAIAGVTRAISALLNSEGGLVIWGAPKGEKNANKVKIFKGKVCPVNTLHEKDWLINKISDNITPLPIGIRVKTLQDLNRQFIYVFEVQESNYKPHQFEHIYPIRLDGQTKPAPHYLVDAMFKQIRFPLIEGYLKFITLSRPHGVHLKILLQVYLYNFTPLQPEEAITFFLKSSKGMFSNNTLIPSAEISLLHYGSPFVRDYHLVIDKSELSDTNTRVDFTLTFQGKNSPVKKSWYEADLPEVKAGNVIFPQSAIIRTAENITTYEADEWAGITRSDILKKDLGR